MFDDDWVPPRVRSRWALRIGIGAVGLVLTSILICSLPPLWARLRLMATGENATRINATRAIALAPPQGPAVLPPAELASWGNAGSELQSDIYAWTQDQQLFVFHALLPEHAWPVLQPRDGPVEALGEGVYRSAAGTWRQTFRWSGRDSIPDQDRLREFHDSIHASLLDGGTVNWAYPADYWETAPGVWADLEVDDGTACGLRVDGRTICWGERRIPQDAVNSLPLARDLAWSIRDLCVLSLDGREVTCADQDGHVAEPTTLPEPAWNLLGTRYRPVVLWAFTAEGRPMQARGSSLPPPPTPPTNPMRDCACSGGPELCARWDAEVRSTEAKARLGDAAWEVHEQAVATAELVAGTSADPELCDPVRALIKERWYFHYE